MKCGWGQKNTTVYQWAPRGTRPRQPADQRYESAYLFGALCPARDTGAALVLPVVNTQAMQYHLDEISAKVAPGAHAIVLSMANRSDPPEVRTFSWTGLCGNLQMLAVLHRAQASQRQLDPRLVVPMDVGI